MNQSLHTDYSRAASPYSRNFTQIKLNSREDAIIKNPSTTSVSNYKYSTLPI